MCRTYEHVRMQRGVVWCGWIHEDIAGALRARDPFQRRRDTMPLATVGRVLAHRERTGWTVSP